MESCSLIKIGYYGDSVMKKLASILLLASFCIILSGCVFSIGGGGHKHKCPKECPDYVSSDPTITEIKAVGNLMSESGRFEVYHVIAQRPDLSAEARAFLSAEATNHLMSETNRQTILLTLAKNPPPPQPIAEPAKDTPTETNPN
jgi:hypothetical protein